MSDAPEPSEFTESLPIKIGKISKWLWPRKIYVRVKKFHPIAGSIFITIWSVFWFVLAITLNILILGIIILTILFLITAIFSDSSFDTVFIFPSWSHSDNTPTWTDKEEEENRKRSRLSIE